MTILIGGVLFGLVLTAVGGWVWVVRRQRARPPDSLRPSGPTTNKGIADEARLTEILGSTEDAILETALDGTLVTWNPGAARMFGYTATEMIGRSIEKIVSREGREALQKVFGLVALGQRADRFEAVGLRYDEERFDLSLSISALSDDKGRVAGALAIARDLTERKRTERQLEETEGHYRDLVGQSEDWIWTQDLEGRVLSVNPAMMRQAGYSEKELLGRKLIDFLTPESRQEFEPLRSRVSREGQAQGFLRIVTASGEERVLEYDVTLRATGSSQSILYGIAHDVQRRWAERALRLSLNRLEALLNNIPDMAWMKDGQGRFVAVNEAFARAVKRDRESIVGKTDFDLFPEALAKVFQEEDQTVLATGKTLLVAHPVPTADGRTVLFEIIKPPIWGGGQKPTGTAGIARDTTERHMLEAQLRHSQKMEAIGRLAGGVAHDFNNLLTSILGYSELVLQRIGENHLAREDVEEIRRVAERATVLTGQLLAFGRRQVLKAVVLDLGEVVANVERMLRRLVGENIDLATKRDPKLRRIKADSGQIEQVIVNLVVNARDAMPEGGKITIETKNVTLQDSDLQGRASVPAGSYAMLSVADTGSGMDNETRTHIFEPFFTTKAAGTGLGLATVYGIVKQSGGHIVLESEPGRGSVFRVYLPWVEEPAEETPLGFATPSSD